MNLERRRNPNQDFTVETPKLVIAIDFGTYRSSIITYDVRQNKTWEFKNWGRGPKVLKGPTSILYESKTLKPLLIGWEAELTYASAPNKKEYILEKYFKLSLNSRYTQQGNLVEKCVSDYLSLLKSSAETIFKNETSQTFLEYSKGLIRWCLTLPAIWDERQKQLMVRAAFVAGLTRSEDPLNSGELIIVIEPEAAAARFVKHKVGINDNVECLDKKTVAVVDIGGGTGDLAAFGIDVGPGRYDSSVLQRRWVDPVSPSTGGPEQEKLDKMVSNINQQPLHFQIKDNTQQQTSENRRGHTSEMKEKDYYLSELCKSAGHLFGGVSVNKAFKKDIEKKIGSDKLRKYIEENSLDWYRFEESFETLKCQKQNLDTPTNDEIIPKGNLAKLLNIVPGEAYVITLNDWNNYFKETLSQSHMAVTNLCEQLKSKNIKLDYVFLVGGFATSQILQQSIRNSLQTFFKTNNSPELVIPNPVDDAIVQGASLLGLRPGMIISRVCKETYGISVYEKYDTSQHSGKYWIDPKSQQKWATGVFKTLAMADHAYAFESTIPVEVSVLYPGQRLMSIAFYKTKLVKGYVPKTVDEEGTVELVGNIILQLDKATMESKILINILFGNSMVQARAFQDGYHINVTLQSDPRESVMKTNVVFITDTSFSMSATDVVPKSTGFAHNRLGAVLASCLSFVNLRLSHKDDTYSLVSFNTNAEVIFSNKEFKNSEEFKNLISNMKPKGSTSFSNALKTVYENSLIHSDADMVNVVIFLSDSDDMDEGTPYQEWLKKIMEKSSRLSFNTILVGNKDDNGRLKDMAELGNGSFICVGDEEELLRAFEVVAVQMV